MRLGHALFGYRIVNGTAEIEEEEAKKLQTVYAGYLSGLSYIEAAKRAGLSMTHSSVKMLLQDKRYLGDDFYPALIEQETYEAAEQERLCRAKMRKRQSGRMQERKVMTQFTMKEAVKRLKDPYAHAEYLYSLIGSEV